MHYAEEKIQIRCVSWFRNNYPDYARLLLHIPNGGARSKVEGAIFKAMGVQAGAPDLMLCVAREGYHALFIEMKSSKGSQSESQKEYQLMLEAQGYCYRICRDIYEFKKICLDYLGPVQNLDLETLRRMINGK